MLNVEGHQVTKTVGGFVPAVPKEAPNLKVMSISFLLPNRDAPVMWRGPRKTNMIKRFLKDTLWSRLDFLLIDFPPGFSDEHISLVSFFRNLSFDALIVTTPNKVCHSTVRKELDFCSKMKVNVIGICENMSGYICPCCNTVTDLFGSEHDKISSEYNLPLLSKIPIDPAVCSSGDSEGSLFTQHPQSASTKIFEELANKIEEMTEK